MASEAEADAPAQRAEQQPVEAAEEQPKEEEREREDDEGSELSKRRKDKKKKKHKSEKRKNRDRSRERSASRDRSRDKSRRRSRDRSRDRSRRRSDNRDRDRDRERERERRRDRDSREDSRDRRYRSSRRRSGSRSYRRRRNESKDRRSSSRRRDDRREKSKSKDRTDGGSNVNIPGVPTLKEIMFENPGMSVVEALRRQAEIKAALGIEVPGLNAPRITPYGAPAGYGAPGAFGGVGGFSSAGGFTGGGLPGTLAPGFTAGAMAPRAAAAAVAGTLPSPATKVHRELYVGNLPPGVQSAQIVEFMNSAMVSANLAQQPGPSVLNAWVSSDGHYAFVEFRTPEEATAAVNFLNNIAFGSYNLRIGRPRGYVADPTVASSGAGLGLGTIAVPGMAPITPAIPGVGAAAAEQSNTLMLTNLPKDVAADQVRELVTAFGPLKAFNMIVDPNGKARATAVFEYEDPSLTEGVIKGLTDFELGDQKLGIQRVPASVAATLLQPVGQLPDLEPTRTLRLSNMVTSADMADPEVMEEIKEDVADECNKYGTVLSVEAPMSGDGAGYIFVQFANTDGCGRAKQAIGGRLFNGNTVAAQYYPDELFEQKTFQAPSGYFDRK